MCDQYWRNCKSCGTSVHMNFKCTKCGGDPWNTEAVKQAKIAKLNEEKAKLMERINIIDKRLASL